MIITIDTSKDSHTEMKRAAELLLSMVGEQVPSSNVLPSAPDPTPEAAGAFTSLFGDDSTSVNSAVRSSLSPSSVERSPVRIELY